MHDPDMREGYADVAGARLWYRDTGGSGIPIVLLHPGFGHGEFFERYQRPALASAGYRAILYDRRGYGRSQVTGSAADASYDADDLHALAAQLALDRFHVVAIAAGGIVAVDYALSQPQRLRSLVIANSIVGVQDEDYLELGRQLRPPEFDALPVHVKELGPEYRAANPQGVAQWIELQSRWRPAGPRVPNPPPRNRITFAALRTIELRTLLLTGDADLYSPPAVMQLVAACMPNAEFASLPAVGHSAFWEQPEAFNRRVLEFVGRA